MRIFLAGASGAIGRRLVPLLLDAGHQVTGTTRHPETAMMLERAGVVPTVVDVFDAPALTAAVGAAQPAVVIHQLTDLPRELDGARIAASACGNARIRSEGTRNLVAATQAAGAHRFIVQSISFAYAPGTWYGTPDREPGLHVDAAAQAALLAVTHGGRGVYNIADDDEAVSIAKARAELGFDPTFRIGQRTRSE